MIGKRGQATVFIIIGILIILGVVSTLLAQEYVFKSKFEREKAKISLTEEFEPVYAYFESCLGDLAKESAVLIGQQGGHIELEDVNPLLDFTSSLDLFGNDAARVSYWFSKSDNGIQTEDIPTLEEMEDEIERYVEDNSELCIDNFTFPGYELEGFDTLDSEVEIEENKIFIEVTSPLTLYHESISQEVDKFFVVVDVPLGKLYDLSKDIYERQKADLFF